MAIQTHLDTELKLLKQDLLYQFRLVVSQFEKGKKSLEDFDKDIAREVILGERRINAMELKIDRDCENIFALFQPVAVDLRFVLASLKINSNLERIGDIAEGIARFVQDIKNTPDPELLKNTRLLEMFETVNTMLNYLYDSFEKDDTSLARKIFRMDDILDEINIAATTTVGEFIKAHPEKMNQSLYILSMIRKLERAGDQSKNIAEEIIFFIEAKVLKHRNKNVDNNPD